MNEKLTNSQHKLSKWFIKNAIKNKSQYKKYPQSILLNYNDEVIKLNRRNIYYYQMGEIKVYFFEDINYVYMFVDIDIFNTDYGIEGTPMMLYSKRYKTIDMFDETKIEIFDC